MNLKGIRCIVVGSGLTGSVIAERVAEDLNQKVVVIEKRHHYGGNCHSEVDSKTGIEVHKYGTHVFHTGNRLVWDYLSRFMSLNHYRHRVYTRHKNRIYPMPINLDTVSRFYNSDLDPEGMRQLLENKIAGGVSSTISSLEEQAISLVGKELYEALIKGYTYKQWGVDPKLLPAATINRLPVRFSYESDYFDDPYQGLPADGYSGLFRQLLNHRNIDLHQNTDFYDIKDLVPANCIVVFTGAIDRYFGFRFGRLGWRSLRFETETVGLGDFQGTSVINYADIDIPYTRIHEFKHLHPERQYHHGSTVVSREYPCDFSDLDNEPYYPINTEKDKATFRLYSKAAEMERNVIFCGRLGAYRYYDMDDAVAEALNVYHSSLKERLQ